MLIHFVKTFRPDLSAFIRNRRDDLGECKLGRLDIGDLNTLYKEARSCFDANTRDFQDLSRKEVVKLQCGDNSSLLYWRYFCDLSRAEFQKNYDLLDIQIEERGESFYNNMLQKMVNDLITSGNAVFSEGAVCIFVRPSTESKVGLKEPLVDQPFILQKSDGGFLYNTTDLAAVKYRFTSESDQEGDCADEIIYVTDIGQSLHFERWTVV